MDAPPETKGLERIAFDLNRDSQPDIFKYYEGAQKDANNIVSGGVLRRKDIDLNANGSIDVVQLFEDDEVLKQERQDPPTTARSTQSCYSNRIVLKI